MGLPYKYRKYGCIALIINSVVCFFGYAFYINHKANLEFYKSSFSGKVIEKRIHSDNHGSTIITFSNGERLDLSVYYSDLKNGIEIGDSVFKIKNSFHIYRKTFSGAIIDCTREDFKNKSMRIN